MNELTRTQRGYTLAFKQAVVDQVEGGELTYKQAQARYRIQCCCDSYQKLHRQHGFNVR